jgi:hypothetical protein
MTCAPLARAARFIHLTTTQPAVAGAQPSAIEIGRHICLIILRQANCGCRHRHSILQWAGMIHFPVSPPGGRRVAPPSLLSLRVQSLHPVPAAAAAALPTDRRNRTISPVKSGCLGVGEIGVRFQSPALASPPAQDVDLWRFRKSTQIVQAGLPGGAERGQDQPHHQVKSL